MKRLVLVVVTACGGGAKSGTTLPATGLSECAVVGGHLADAVFTWKEPPPTKKENVARVVTEHCEGDQWSAAAKQCFGAVSDEESAKPCVETLSKDQHDKVMTAMEATFENLASPESVGAPGGAPTGADPCEGGE